MHAKNDRLASELLNIGCKEGCLKKPVARGIIDGHEKGIDKFYFHSEYEHTWPPQRSRVVMPIAVHSPEVGEKGLCDVLQLCSADPFKPHRLIKWREQKRTHGGKRRAKSTSWIAKRDNGPGHRKGRA
jgi:hypothetical protein